MPVVIGEGVALVDVFLFVAMLAIAVILWSTLQARQPAGNVPIVGSVLVGAIDGIRQAVTQLALQLEQFFSWQQSQVNQLWQAFILQVLNPAVAGWQNAIVSVGLAVEGIASRDLPAVQAAVSTLQRESVNVVAPQLGQLTHDLAAVEAVERDVTAPAIAQLSAQASTAAQDAAQLAGRVKTLEQQLAAAEGVLERLAPFLPLLGSLATFESGTAGGVSALERQVGLSQQQLKDLQEQLAKLIGLGGIAALGAVAIANLARVARDPCRPCGNADLSNYEARLFALEMFGET